MISSSGTPENRSIYSVRVLCHGSEIDVIWLESVFNLWNGTHTSKEKISFSPGGRIIHICSRLRKPESPLRATCSLQAHMQSKRLKYHRGAHFPDEKTEVKGLDQGHTTKYVKCQNKPRVSSVQSLSHV